MLARQVYNQGQREMTLPLFSLACAQLVCHRPPSIGLPDVVFKFPIHPSVPVLPGAPSLGSCVPPEC